MIPASRTDPLRSVRSADLSQHCDDPESWWAILPIYVYQCDCGLRFERLLPVGAEAPGCPDCGSETRKMPAGSSLGGRAGKQPVKNRPAEARPTADSGAPQWLGLRTGGPEKVQREVEFRQRLAAEHAATPAPGPAGGDGGGAASPGSGGS